MSMSKEGEETAVVKEKWQVVGGDGEEEKEDEVVGICERCGGWQWMVDGWLMWWWWWCEWVGEVMVGGWCDEGWWMGWQYDEVWFVVGGEGVDNVMV